MADDFRIEGADAMLQLGKRMKAAGRGDLLKAMNAGNRDAVKPVTPATRKRALDLLPLLAHLDEERVRSVLPHEKIGSRPVFHYRLPHAHLSDPTWSIMPDWNRWLLVERLASDLEEPGEKGKVALSPSA